MGVNEEGLNVFNFLERYRINSLWGDTYVCCSVESLNREGSQYKPPPHISNDKYLSSSLINGTEKNSYYVSIIINE